MPLAISLRKAEILVFSKLAELKSTLLSTRGLCGLFLNKTSLLFVLCENPAHFFSFSLKKIRAWFALSPARLTRGAARNFSKKNRASRSWAADHPQEFLAECSGLGVNADVCFYGHGDSQAADRCVLTLGTWELDLRFVSLYTLWWGLFLKDASFFFLCLGLSQPVTCGRSELLKLEHPCLGPQREA
jgi:hypothetical protein